MTGNFDKPLTERMHPDGSVVSLRAYELAGGYQAIRKVLRTGMTPMAVTEEVKEANLRGRGGAGFQTGVKWSFVPRGKDVPNPTYLVVNGDEMEPGTFKDRLLMERDPHQLIEGARCGFTITPDLVKRVDFDLIECPICEFQPNAKTEKRQSKRFEKSHGRKRCTHCRGAR